MPSYLLFTPVLYNMYRHFVNVHFVYLKLFFCFRFASISMQRQEYSSDLWLTGDQPKW